MAEVEIYLILKCYFSKVIEKQFQLKNLVLEFGLPDAAYKEPNVLKDLNVSVVEFKLRIHQVLAKAFKHPILINDSSLDPFVTVTADQMRGCFESYKVPL